MTLRRIRFSVVVLVLTVFMLAAEAMRPAATNGAAAVKASQGWVFEGCWTYWPAGPCRDVFRDTQGNYWICGGCGTTGTPSTKKCSRISPQTLNIGYWCS
jgi:hypothetical protein